MTEQNYANHAYAPRLAGAAAAGWAAGVIGALAAWWGYGWGVPVAAAGVLIAVLCLISISRVYTTRLQDRIIHLEEQLRAERLLTPAQVTRWHALDIKQVVALRFASDEEFGALVDRAADERLVPDAIKRAVITWRADLRRT